MTQSFSDHPDAPDIESSTPDYATRFSGEVGAWFLDVQCHGTEALIREAGTKPASAEPLRILDVGGGHAQNIPVSHALNAELTIVGSDASCAQLLTGDEANVSFQQGALKTLPFADNSFDVVLCYRIMAHIDDWPALVTELVRVSRSLVLVDYAATRSANALAEALFSLKKGLESNTRVFRLHTHAEVDAAFVAAGASRCGRYPQFFFPMALHRGLKQAKLSAALEKMARGLGLSALLGSPVIAAYQKK